MNQVATAGSRPFVLHFLSRTRTDSSWVPELRYSDELQRNLVELNDEWVDVVEASSQISGSDLITMTRGATMTDVGRDTGTYKLDDDH